MLTKSLNRNREYIKHTRKKKEKIKRRNQKQQRKIIQIDLFVKHLLHELVGNLHTGAVPSVSSRSPQRSDRDMEGNSQSSRVGGHGTAQRGPEAGEEGLETTVAVDGADGAPDGGTTGVTLQARLDGVDGEDGDPHGHTGGTTGRQDGGHGQIARDVAVGILGGQAALDVLVGGEVGGGTGAITGQGHGAAAEDAADATLLVQLTDDVHAARVLGLLARRGRVLALDLQQHLDPLEGGGDEGHGNGGEETRGGDLTDAVLGSVVLHAHVGHAADDRLAQIIALSTVSIGSAGEGTGEKKKKLLTQKLTANMGVTPTRGAETPAYRPCSKH